MCCKKDIQLQLFSVLLKISLYNFSVSFMIMQWIWLGKFSRVSHYFYAFCSRTYPTHLEIFSQYFILFYSFLQNIFTFFDCSHRSSCLLRAFNVFSQGNFEDKIAFINTCRRALLSHANSLRKNILLHLGTLCFALQFVHDGISRACKYMGRRRKL